MKFTMANFPSNSLLRFLPNDPRYYQIAVLSSLVIVGVAWLGFEMTGRQILILLASALATQYACGKLAGGVSFDPKSPLISALSLCLLLRTNDSFLLSMAAIVALASKFIFRRSGKHLFNPTNFGIVAMLALGADVWVSPAQWGSKFYFAFLMACLGGMVIHRAMRSDVSYAFLFSFSAILFTRSWWLGDPWVIPLKQLQSGALLLFTFFMISDPKTTPDSRAGRIVFALLVAAGAAYVQFGLFRTNGLLWSLALCSLATPLLDYLLPGKKYQWNTRVPSLTAKGDAREKNRLMSHPAMRNLA
jgi:enediyne biosynthesis protein E5